MAALLRNRHQHRQILYENIANRAARRALRAERTYFQHTSPLDSISNEECKERYRFSKETIVKLVEVVGEDFVRQTNRSNPIEPVQAICLALELLGSDSYQRVIGHTEHFSAPTVCRSLWTFVDSLVAHTHKFIKFPTGRQAEDVKTAFFQIAGVYCVLRT